MNENKHTPEPWAYYDDRKSTGRIEIVGLGKTVSRIYLSVPDEDVANARRITACVNACAGIETGHLEKYGLPDFAQKIFDLREQRDELLKALENTHNALKHFWPEGHADAIAAIAGVKGEQ